MAATSRRADRPRPATSTTRACLPQLPRRPRWWGRPLVLGMTLVLAAALGTRALADTDESGSSLESFGEAPGPQTDRPQARAEMQQPAAGSSGGTDGEGSAVMTGAGPGGEVDPEVPVVARAQPEPTDDVAEGKDQAGQDRPRGGPGACASGCSTAPPDSGTPPVAAASPGDGRGLVARILQAIGLRQPQEPAPQAPEPAAQAAQEGAAQASQAPRLTLAELHSRGLTVTQLEQETDAVQAELQPQDRIRTLSEIAESYARIDLILENVQRLEAASVTVEEAGQLTAVRDAVVAARQGLTDEHSARQIPTPLNMIASRIEEAERRLDFVRIQERAGLEAEAQMNRSRAQIQLYWAHRRLMGLGPEAAQGPEAGKLVDLTSRAEALQRLLEGGNPMSMVGPDEVGRGRPTTEGNQVKVPVTPGFPEQTNPPDLNTGFADGQPSIPDQGGFRTTELDNRPLTRDQEAAAQATSDTWERIIQAGPTATRYLTWGTVGAGIVYALVLLNGAAAGLAGAFLPPELRENNPLAPPRPTQG
jgi:hypothetical protein